MDTMSLKTSESFEEVMKFYMPMVYRIAFSRLGSTHEAEDITQEVFLKYFRADISYNDEEHRKAWLIRVTINCAKDLLRGKPSWEELNETIAGDDVPAVSSEEQLDLHKAIQQLRLEYREAICLHYLEGLSVKEIADILGRNENTVKTHLARGREMLRKFLED